MNEPLKRREPCPTSESYTEREPDIWNEPFRKREPILLSESWSLREPVVPERTILTE